MTNPAAAADSRHPSMNRRWWVAAVVLLLIGAGFLAVSLLGHHDPLNGPAGAAPPLSSPSSAGNTPATATSTPTPSATPTAKPSAKPPGMASAQQSGMARSAPASLRIPAIGVSLSLSTLGLNPDGTVQVPAKDQAPGWFRLGPTPGQIGSAVILGHVDDYRGPAAFYRLRSLRPGDKVDVSLADGMVAHFVVRQVASYLKTQFPAQQVYASRGYSALQLVTCGGQFDSSTGHYLSNTVVYTSWVATTPA
jgi:sortase (surface protein transpeptidase)